MKAYWFKGIRTPEKAKERWHELCREHHPDNGGDPARMQQIMAEYQSLVTAFAWKEEWDKDKGREPKKQPKKQAATKQATTSQKCPKKKTTPSRRIAVQGPAISAHDDTSKELNQLIDAGMEFGKLLIRNIVSRRSHKANG